MHQAKWIGSQRRFPQASNLRCRYTKPRSHAPLLIFAHSAWSHHTAKHTNPTKRSEAYCWHKLLTLLSHFLTSLTTAMFSSLAPYHRSDLCGGNWTGYVSPTVVTWPKIPPPTVAAGWLLASNSYEVLRGFMLQMREAQKMKIIYLRSFFPELMFTVVKVV